jgi:energy-coupling factor transport system permease protein
VAGFFVTDQSFLGRCHPASRILLLIGACLPPLLVDQAAPAACLLVLYLAAALAFSAWPNVWRVRGLIVAFLVVTAILWPLFHRTPDPPLFKIGPFAPSYGSLLFALAMGLRMVALLVAGVVFLSATRIEDISYGLQKLGMPFRMSFAFSLAFRLTPLFMNGASQIATAQKVRGLDLNAVSLLPRLKGYVAILAPVLITALRRADGLALALESKGFGRSSPRTSFRQYGTTWRDILLLSTITAVIVCTASWRLDLFGLRRLLDLWGSS